LLWDMCVSGKYWERHKLSSVSQRFNKGDVAKLRNRLGMFSPEKNPWRTIRDAIGNVPDPRENHGIRDHIFRDGARSYPGHTGSDYDWPSKTIKAGGHGVPGGENMIRYADNSLRYFTVFEAKKIQTFPDDFIITGAWGEAFRQIGNAVPVALAEAIGKELFKTLEKAKIRSYSLISQALKSHANLESEILVANR